MLREAAALPRLSGSSSVASSVAASRECRWFVDAEASPRAAAGYLLANGEPPARHSTVIVPVHTHESDVGESPITVEIRGMKILPTGISGPPAY